MRKLATLLSLALIASALHFGAMAGFQVVMKLATSHSAHAGHVMPMVPSCPVDAICPVASNPFVNLNTTVLLLLFVCFAALLAAVRLPVLATPLLAYAGLPAFRPNSANALLSVFKRE